MTTKKKNKMNQKENEISKSDLEAQTEAMKTEQAVRDLHLFSSLIDHKEFKRELWEQLYHTITSEDEFMDHIDRANYMDNYKLLLKTSKAIRILYPALIL